jgi:hypothetical protein
MERRRLFLYLLLNVFVSACVTGAILFWYDQNYRAAVAPVSQVAVPVQSNATANPLETLSSDAQVQVEIVSVTGAGTLELEVVIVRYNGEGELELANWQLKDDDGNVFTFPKLTLYTDGAVQVHTNSGPATVVDLYMGHREPIWESGEVAKLFDPQDNVRAMYRVP